MQLSVDATWTWRLSMTPITIVDNDFITLQDLPDKKLIYHTIHRPVVDDQEFKGPLDAGTEALKTYKVYKWLSDDRKNGPLSAAFLQWSASDWQPRTITAGWKYWANVVPTKLVAAGTLLPVIDNLYEMGLHMMVFSSLDEAINWLDRL